MKILLDTNVLISALIFGGRTGRLLDKLFELEHELLVTHYVDQEFKDKLEQKWPDKAKNAYNLFHTMDFIFCDSTAQVMGILRDKKDIPVLSDAIYHNVDMILTGDRDFLDEELEKPLVFSPGMLCEYLGIK